MAGRKRDGGLPRSVTLLRDGVTPVPGYGPLVLVPMTWAALRGRRPELIGTTIGASLALLGPIVLIGGARYPGETWRGVTLLVIVGAVLTGAALALVERLRSGEERHRQLAESSNEMLVQQNALRQIATLVAGGAPPAELFQAVAAQLASLFGGKLGGVVRFDGPAGVGTIVGGWSADGADTTGMTIDLVGPSAAALVYRTGKPIVIEQYDGREREPILVQFDLGVAVCAPIFVNGRLWGSVGASFGSGVTIPADTNDRLVRFAELVAVAIANAQAWETLTHRAATDPLTGLANHRTFHEALAAEAERASRHGRALSIALFDVDHFKRINDTHGHQVGDATLVAVANRLAAVARTGEIVARTGGEEFAWLMPETTQDGAYLAAERARHSIEETPFDKVGSLTISAGVCSNLHADTPSELFRAADRALYRAKRNGRNLTFVPGSEHSPAHTP